VLILNPFVFGTTMKVEHTSERGWGLGAGGTGDSPHVYEYFIIYIGFLGAPASFDPVSPSASSENPSSPAQVPVVWPDLKWISSETHQNIFSNY